MVSIIKVKKKCLRYNFAKTLLVFFMFFVCACNKIAQPYTEITKPAYTITPRNTITPYNTITPTSTQIPTKFPTKIVTFSLSLTEISPMASPLPTITPSDTPVALSLTGPWLLGSMPKTHNRVFCNIDGTGCVPVELPKITWGHFQNEIYYTDQGQYFAFAPLEKESDPQIWVTQWLGMKVVRKIQLISDLLQQTLPENIEPNKPVSFYYSVTDENNIRWSPNGRYLAYVAAQDNTESDLYVYDTTKDEIKRLSDEPESVGMIGWSPDSQWLVYMMVNQYDIFGTSIKSVAAIRADGTDQRILYEWGDGRSATIYYEVIIGWTTNHSFLVMTDRFEGAPSDIREVDILKRKVTSLYPYSFLGVEVDEKTKTLFFYMYEFKGMFADYNGIFRLNEHKKLEEIVHGEVGATWQAGLNALVIYDYSGTPPKSLIFDYTGKKIGEYGGQIFPSPDGRWIVVSEDSGTNLYAGTGEFIQNIAPDSADNIVWLRNSDGFYSERRRGDINLWYLYLQSIGWQGIKIENGFGTVRIIYP